MIKIDWDKDYHYFVNVESTDVHWGEHRDNNGHVHVGQPIDPRVDSISVRQTYSFADAWCTGDALEKALAQRLIRFTIRPNMFTISTNVGWYGEEIGRVSLDRNKASALSHKVALFNRFPKRRVGMVLNLEYGFLLEELQQYDKGWRLANINIKQLYVAPEILKTVDQNTVEDYNLFDFNGHHNTLGREYFPAIVAVPLEDKRYRLIDGRHRYVAWTTRKIKPRKIKVIIPRKK